LVLVTIVSGDDDRVFDIVQFDILVKNIRDGTLSTRPGLDTDTVLAVVTGRIQDTDGLDSIIFTTLTERANAETVTTVTGDLGQSDISDTTVDGSTVITDVKFRVSKDDVAGRRDIQSVRVLGRLAALGGGLEGNIFNNKVIGISSAHVSTRRVNDVKVAEDRVSNHHTKDSRSSVILLVVPRILK
jgi:hypothetical protein